MVLRVVPIAALLLLSLTACKKKGPEPAAATVAPPAAAPGFLDLGAIDEEEDLAGSELMVATAKCGDLKSLEPAAMMGKLKDGEIRCLDDALKAAEKQTSKDKISRVLMADAWAKSDKVRWEAIVRRHLNEIDRSDADLCYKFAKLLSDKGPADADEAMHWADMALENRSQWPAGDVHVGRVYSLYKLKALVAQGKWTWLEEKYLKEPTEELASEKDHARSDAKTAAREWLEYATQAGKDATLAMQLCVSAAGTEDYCQAQP